MEPAKSLALIALLVASGACIGAETDSATPVESDWKYQPYVSCDGFAGGVRGVALDRRPAQAEPWREVGFDGATAQVSVLDGYRVLYSYPRTLPFANLKAERSDPARYNEDKRIVRAHFASIAKADGNVALARFSERGFAVENLTKKKLGGRTMGITQIFSDGDGVIVTIYFLNQLPDLRRFQSRAEFVALRDRFVRGYLECVERRRTQTQ